MSVGSRTFAEKFLRAVNISGNVYELNATAGAGANNTTIARYLAGGTTTSRRFRPTQTTTTSNAVPSVGTAAANDGWREAAAQDATNRIVIGDDANWVIKFRYRRSGQSLEIDQPTTVTFILYRVTSAGVFVSEVTRASVNVTFTTTVQTTTPSFSPGDVTLNAGDKLQLEIYVVTLAAGVPTAPAAATDLWCTIDETSANGAKVTAPNYRIEYVRSQTATMRGVASLARDLTLKRTLSARMAGVASIRRKTSKTLAARMVGVATLIRKTSKTLAAVMLGVATLTRLLTLRRTLTGIMVGVSTLTSRLALFRTLAARMAGVATLSRRLILRRTLSATMIGRAFGYLRLPFDKVPSGGTSTTIRKILNIFDD